MAAYVIGEIEVTDPAAFAEYRKHVAANIESHGGRIVARDDKVQTLEGGWVPRSIVIVEFSSMEQALAWYHAPDYAPLIKMREPAARAKLIAVQGA